MTDFVVIKASRQSRDLLTKLSQEYDVRKYIYLQYVLEFFDKTGYDPQDTKIASPAEEVKKLRNTFVSFLRKQEKDLLYPLLDRVEQTLILQTKLIQEQRQNIPPVKEPKAKPVKSGRLLIPASAYKNRERPVPQETVDRETYQKLKAKLAFLESRIEVAASGGKKTYKVELTELEYERVFG